MQVENAIEYPGATPEQVFEMMINKEFRESVCRATHALSYEVQVVEESGRVVVTSSRTLPTDGLPEFAKSLVRGGIHVRETLRWGPAAANGVRAAEVLIEFVGQPLQMTGSLRIGPDGSGTVGSLAGDLKANIPLFGGRIEQAVAPLVVKAMEVEQQLGRDWLAEH